MAIKFSPSHLRELIKVLRFKVQTPHTEALDLLLVGLAEVVLLKLTKLHQTNVAVKIYIKLVYHH